MTHVRFAATIFVGATLLFSCQPMIARMILPLLGGAPAVWIICSLCFQTLLLAGYAYVHWVGTRTRLRTQIVLQLALLGAVFAVMPVSVDDAAGGLVASHPTLGIVVLLVRTIGLPFFVLSTSSPLLQRWFAEAGETDPYHLYAASNAGSMIALLGYPFLVEPHLALPAQSRVLHAAFAVYTVLVALCALAAARRAGRGGRVARARGDARLELDAVPTPAPAQVQAGGSEPPPMPVSERLPGIVGEVQVASRPWRERLVWIALASVPSSLLLGATTYVTTDIASVPLLWVLPLALYLASFIVAFAKRQIVAPAIVSRALALVVALVAALMLFFVARPAWLLVGGHMVLLFLACVTCHRGLAERRPPVARLTEFYLLLSVGGVLGGLFNGVVAPVLFADHYEYPLAIGAACLCRVAVRGKPSSASGLRNDVAWGTALGAAAFLFVTIGERQPTLHPSLGFAWMFGLPLVVALAWARRPVRFAIAIAGLLLAGTFHGGPIGKTLYAERNFFGVLKVTRAPDGRARLLVSGRTMHGRESLDPATARIPLAYYHPSGPAGDVLGPLPGAPPAVAGRRVGVVGLGIGALAAYARAGDTWTFFEIDPAVETLAREHFGYVGAARSVATIDVAIGDARLMMRDGPAARFDVLVVDAFSSDAIPVHLATREALAVYRRAIRPGGLLLVHVSNLHVDLQPVFGALAREAGAFAIVRRDVPKAAEAELGKAASEWVVLSDSAAALAEVTATHAANSANARGEGAGWQTLEAPPGQAVWTDAFANVLGALRF